MGPINTLGRVAFMMTGIGFLASLAGCGGDNEPNNDPACPGNQAGIPDTSADPRYPLEIDCYLINNGLSLNYPVDMLCLPSDASQPENCDGSIDDLVVTCYQDGEYFETTMEQGDLVYYDINGDVL